MTPAPSIILISLQNSFIDFGIRYVAASCRARHVETHVLWIPREPEESFSESECQIIADWIRERNPHLVGIGLMSIVLSRAVMLTRSIRKKTGIPVIWGGIQPILEPEKCLDHADFVCVGDGESVVPELAWRLAKQADSGNWSIDNIWFRKGSDIIKGKRRLVSNLNEIPFPDYQLESHSIFEQRAVKPLTVERMRRTMPWNLGRHYVISSRGCPFSCSYCINSTLQGLFGETHYLRIRSVDNTMREILEIREQFPFVQTFAIMDDSFFFKPEGWVESFCDQFKRTGATFGCLIHPKTVTRERMEMLVDAGLIGVQMGLQSGSEKVSRDIFNRPEPVSEFIRAAAVLDEFMDRLQARTYDVIVDNPFESDEDQCETIRVLASLNKPFFIDLFSLTLYPGSALYRWALREKKSLNKELFHEDKNFLNVKPTMLNRLTWMTHTTPGTVILFFLENRKKWWARFLFFLYYHLWEVGLRVILRHGKRTLKRFATRLAAKR